MHSSDRDGSPVVRVLVTLLLFVAAASLAITAGVAAEHTGGEEETLEPADQVIVEGDQVVLVYEEEEDQEDIVSADFGADTTNGILYGDFQFAQGTNNEFEGTATSEVTSEAFTAEVDGRVNGGEQLQEEVQDLSAEFNLKQSNSENSFDLSAEGVVQENLPAEVESSGEVVVSHDETRFNSDLRAESLLLQDGTSLDVSADVSQTSDGFVVEVDQSQQAPDLSSFETQEQAQQAIQFGAQRFVSEYNGSAAVTINSHSYESGENVDSLDMSYTVELQNFREGFASTMVERPRIGIVQNGEMTAEERDAFERLLLETQVDSLTLNAEKTTSGTVTADISMATSGYNDALLAFMQAGAENEQEVEQVESVLNAQEASGLTQTLSWNLNVAPADGGASVSTNVNYDTSNWGAFTDEIADANGARLFDGSDVSIFFAMQEDGQWVEIESDVRISNPTTSAEGFPDDVWLPNPNSYNPEEDGNVFLTLPEEPADTDASYEALPEGSIVLPVDVGRLEYTGGDQPRLRAGLNFVDRHGPLKALGANFVDRHGPLKVPDRHGPQRIPDRHGPQRIPDQHGPQRVDLGLTEEGAPLTHFYSTSDGDTTTTFVHLGAAGLSEDELRESPVVGENTEIVSPEDRQPQYLDVEQAGELLDMEVTDPSVRPPQLSVTPGEVDEGVTLNPDEGTLDFGELQAGGERRVELTVRNAGGGTLEVENPAFERYKNFVTEPETLSLGAGESQNVSFVYAPQEAGEHTAGLTLEAEDQQFSLNATGTATPPPELSVDPQSVNFDEVEVGDTVTEPVTIANEGEGPLEISRLELRDNEAFGGLGDDEIRGGEGDDTLTIEPGAERTFDIQFSPESEAQQSTSLLIQSNDPTQPNKVVYVSSGNVEATVEVDEENRLQMNAKAEGASPENPAQIKMPDPVENESFETDSLSVTPTEETDVEVNMTTSSKTLETTPESEEGLGNGTEQMGNVSVDANVDNEQIQELEFQTRVDTEQLEEMQSDPGNVSLYRYNEENQEWVEKETEVVGQENGETILQTTATGASEWTAAAKTPEFDITETNIDVTTTTTDEEVTIQVLVTNTGGTDGSYEAELLLDDEVVDQQERTVPNGGTVSINFERSFDAPGLYTVQVNDVDVGEVNVSAAEEEATVEEPDDSSEMEEDNSTETDDSTEMEEDDSAETDDTQVPDGLGPGFGPVAALVAVLSVALYLRRQ